MALSWHTSRGPASGTLAPSGRPAGTTRSSAQGAGGPAVPPSSHRASGTSGSRNSVCGAASGGLDSEAHPRCASPKMKAPAPNKVGGGRPIFYNFLCHPDSMK